MIRFLVLETSDPKKCRLCVLLDARYITSLVLSLLRLILPALPDYKSMLILDGYPIRRAECSDNLVVTFYLPLHPIDFEF